MKNDLIEFLLLLICCLVWGFVSYFLFGSIVLTSIGTPVIIVLIISLRKKEKNE